MKYIYILLISSLISSCASLPRFLKNTTEASGSIPPDFGVKESKILLVLEKSKGYNKYLLKGFKENYRGEVKSVSASAIAKIDAESSKYKDTAAFRYIFYRIKYHTGSGNTAGYASRFYLKDRKTNIIYQSKIGSGSFGLLIKAYAMNLEAKRRENN